MKRAELLPFLSQEHPKRAKVALAYDINDEDHISNLPDELIYILFDLLDYGDLERIICTSRKMQKFAVEAMQKIGKEQLSLLAIRQNRNGDFVVEALRRSNESNKNNFYMLVRRCPQAGVRIRKWTTDSDDRQDDIQNGRMSDPLEERTPIPNQIYESVDYLLKRFKFGRISLEWVLIDDDFKNTMKTLLLKVDNLHLICERTVLTRFDESNTKSFLSWLVSTNAKTVELQRTDCQWISENYVWALSHIAESTSNLDLIIYNANLGGIRFPAEVSIDFFLKFNDLKLYDIMFDANGVMGIIKQRLLKKGGGQWLFYTNEAVDSQERLQTLGDNIEVIRLPQTMPRVRALKLRERDSGFTLILGLSENIIWNTFKWHIQVTSQL